MKMNENNQNTSKNDNATKKKVDRLSFALKQNLLRRKGSKVDKESED